MRTVGTWASAAAVVLSLLGASTPVNAGLTTQTSIVIQPTGSPSGFDDPTPVAPVGGNPGTTLGQQRRNVLNYVAARWAERIQSATPIIATAQFVDQPDTLCSNTSGVLAGAHPDMVIMNFAGAPVQNTYYPIALANAITGTDLDTSGPDIVIEINRDVDSRSDCLGGNGFYYGFDHNRGNRIDLVNTLMHEVGHGLGFSSLVDLTTGQSIFGAGRPLSIFDLQLRDETTGLNWSQLSATQRMLAEISGTGLTWNGPAVSAASLVLTAGRNPDSGRVQMFAPSPFLPGSSVSHWDQSAVPELLMQPFIGATLVGDREVDFTSCALRDIGWTLARGLGCPDSLVDLGVTHSSNTDAITSGSTVTLTATVTNSGPNPAHDVTLNEVFGGVPATVLSVSATQGGCTSLPCNLGLIAANNSATVTIGVRGNAIGTLDATATATSGETEAAIADNSGNAGVVVTAGTGNRSPVAGADQYTIGGNSGTTTLSVLTNDVDQDVGQVLTVTNVGTPLPADSAIVSVANNGTGILFQPGTGFSGTSTFTYTISDGNGGTATGSVTVTVTPAAGGGGEGGGTTGGNTGGFTRGGGGGASFGLLLGLAGLAAARRRRSKH